MSMETAGGPGRHMGTPDRARARADGDRPPPDARIRDISRAVQLSGRTVQAIVADLDSAAYITRIRLGRRSRYIINPDARLRDNSLRGRRLGSMLDC